MIDLDAIKTLITVGIYGDDLDPIKDRTDAIRALTDLVAEIERLRDEADEMRRWAEEAAHAENLNALDAQKERAAVVAWLRDHGSEAWIEHGGLSLVNLDGIADAIERGEHRREEEP